MILATPVRTIVDMLAEVGPILWPGTLIMDMGSTKTEICAAMQALPPGIQPMGGHPMTGKETAGFGAAEPDLYKDATWVLTPLARTGPEALALATELVTAVKARPVVLDPARHDRLVAAISHLPFVLASTLVHTVMQTGADDALVWQLAAGGFRDTSRVAASDTQMFLDILATNRAAVLAQIDTAADHLADLRALIDSGDEEALRAKLAQSQKVRAGWKRQ